MTKNAWILVNRYCLTFNIYRPFLVDSSDIKYLCVIAIRNKIAKCLLYFYCEARLRI